MDVTGHNDLARVRDIVAIAIIQATAQHRFARGDQRNEIGASERVEHQPSDLVDIWYDTPLFNTDTPGWRGPAQIVSIQESERNVTVRFQG